MKEKTYPIYNIGARWHQDDYQNNGTSFSAMFKEDPGISGANQFAMNWWDSYLLKKETHDGKFLYEKNPELIKLSVRFVEYETWCIEWFSHYTYNIELSDTELLESFESFVRRKQRQNVENGHDENDSRKYSELPFYCLMGAEDRWRWKGPCRCEGCIKHGVVRITH